MEGWTRVIGRGAPTLEWARDRAAALASVAAPGVCVPHRVVMSPAGEVRATMVRVQGVSLADLSAAGVRLRAAQVRSVGMVVARALAALHGAGLVHGDVSMSNVMVADGSAVVVDVMTPPQCAGTPGFIDPERSAPAGPADDVYALGCTLLAITDERDKDRVEPWVLPMLEERPRRPHAGQVARAWEQWGPLEPVVVDAVVAQVDARAPRTLPLAQGRAWRLYRMAWRVTRAALGVGTAAVALSLVAGMVSLERPQELREYHPVMAIPAFADRGAEHGAIDLTRRRVEAMANGDALALEQLTAAGSVARQAIQADVERVTSGARWEDAVVVEAEATLLSQRGDRASVSVHYVVSAHVMVQDEERTEVPQTQAQVHLDVVWSTQGWQVERVISVPSPMPPQ